MCWNGSTMRQWIIWLSRNGLSNIGQPAILSILSQQENGVIASQKELARRLRVSPATMTVSLKSMERDGYVKKLSNAEDLRCKPHCHYGKGPAGGQSSLTKCLRHWIMACIVDFPGRSWSGSRCSTAA